MSTPSLVMKLATPRVPSLTPVSFLLRPPAPTRRPVFPPTGIRPTGVLSPSDLTQRLSRELAATDRAETSLLISLAGCALVFLVGCALRVDRFVAGWDSFENFVRAVLS